MERYFEESIDALNYVKSSCTEEIGVLVTTLVAKIKNKKTIFLAGIGGCSSLCDAVSQDMMGFHRPSNRTIKVNDLSANNSLILRNINDLGVNELFSQQLEALGEEGDLLVLLSCSGESKSLIKAAKVAKTHNIETACITNSYNSSLNVQSNISVILPFPSNNIFENTAHVVLHGIVMMVSEALNDDKY